MIANPEILVTGATGTHGGTGAHVIEALRSQGLAVRAIVRTEDARTEALWKMGAEIVTGDFFKLATLRPALVGIKQVFFCFPLAEGLLQATANLCVAAREAGVDTVVNVSILLAAEDHPSPVCRDHWLSERIFDWASVGAVHLRGGFFYENLIRFAARDIIRKSRLEMPFGEGDAKLAWVGAQDVAKVAAAILANPGVHRGQTYRITGEEVMTIRDIAGRFSECLGRPVPYVQVSLEEWLESVASELGDNEQLRRHVSVLSRAFSAGKVVGRTTPHFQQITGQHPVTFAQFVSANVASFSA